MSDAKRIVLVVGATGQQGGGAVDALLQQGKYAVRGLTRNKDSDKAKTLVAKGVEMVQGDLSDVKSLVKAMSGAHGVFYVTDSVALNYSYDDELQHGRNGVDAALEVGIEHFVWSGLEEVRDVPGLKDQLKETSSGHFIPHYESKADVTEYLKKSGLPATVLLTCMFYDNFTSIVPFIPQEDGTFATYNNCPADARVSAHEAADIGRTAALVLADPAKYVGQTVPVASDMVTFDGIAFTISEVTGKTLKYVPISTAAVAAMGFPGALDNANTCEYVTTFDKYNDLRLPSKTVVKGLTFKEWAHKNKDALIAHFDDKH